MKFIRQDGADASWWRADNNRFGICRLKRGLYSVVDFRTLASCLCGNLPKAKAIVKAWKSHDTKWQKAGTT